MAYDESMRIAGAGVASCGEAVAWDMEMLQLMAQLTVRTCSVLDGACD